MPVAVFIRSRNASSSGENAVIMAVCKPNSDISASTTPINIPAKQQSIRQKLHTCPPEQLILITPEYLTPYLTFIRDNRLIYRTALAKPELWRSEQRYNALFRDIFDPILARFHYPAGMRQQVMAFYVGGITAVIAAWLKEDCRQTPDEVIRIIEACIFPREQGFG